MSTLQVHQFHHGAARGDAITDHMLAVRDLLRQEGLASEIFVAEPVAELRAELRDWSAYRSDAAQVLIIHHSYGIDQQDALIALPDHKVLMYHNVTPAHYFATPSLVRRLEQGRDQLARYRPHMAYALAASNYNRRELRRYGYTDVGVLPVHTGLAGFVAQRGDRAIAEARPDGPTWLFVGRLAPHKGQDDVLRAFAHYRRHRDARARLVLVGAPVQAEHMAALRGLAAELGIAEQVTFTGKVSPEALKAYYETADVFVGLSEHEGVCLPLLEAMAAGLPVIAFRAAAVEETMGGAGILLDTKSPEVVSALVHVVLSDEALCRRLVAGQHARLARLERSSHRAILLDAVERARGGVRRPRLHVQGPFETSFSLAIVNRQLAQALDQSGRYEASLGAADGREPAPKALRELPEARRLWERAALTAYPEVVIRNLYPPRVQGALGQLNFLNFAWEETRVPPAYVAQFNRHLDGIGASSRFVRDALAASGVRVPIAVTGNGVYLPADYDRLPPFALRTTKSFRFLHISSGLRRKGVDLLLNAYFKAFSDQDDVTLVLKLPPRPEEDIAGLLAEARARHAAPPEVLLISNDLPEPQLYGLYKAASCYVHAARGEGFGMPVAEAMLAGLPVIVSPHTGLADFCLPETAWLVPFEMVPAESHVSVAGGLWAEPDVEALARLMRARAAGAEPEATRAKTSAARALIAEVFSWEAVAERWEAFIQRTRSARLPGDEQEVR